MNYECNNQLITYFLPVCYLLRIQQYPVNTTCNKLYLSIIQKQVKGASKLFCHPIHGDKSMKYILHIQVTIGDYTIN